MEEVTIVAALVATLAALARTWSTTRWIHSPIFKTVYELKSKVAM